MDNDGSGHKRPREVVETGKFRVEVNPIIKKTIFLLKPQKIDLSSGPSGERTCFFSPGKEKIGDFGEGSYEDA